jgi:YHS domain-containing protein
MSMMIGILRAGAVAASLSMAVVLGSWVLADEPVDRDIPPAWAPLEFLVGPWNGQAMPKDSAQSFRGWPETHTWAWIFTKGKPTGMSVAIRGGKVLSAGKLTFDPARKRYRLEGTAATPPAGPVAFEGALDASGKTLVLDEVAAAKRGSSEAGGARVRLSFRPNSNFIRYTMRVDRKEAGAVQFHPTIEVGLTKEGESLAGGSSASERPKCIVTGGAAAMTLTYQGQTFPICCSGCRDEFNENPEKYIKKASLMAQARGQAKAGQAKPAQVSRFEDAFAGDVADTPAKKSGGRVGSAEGAASADRDNPATKEPETKSATASPAARAASLLRIGQNLEKSGKTRAALDDYKRIVKEFAGTPAARTAKQRIEALEKP